jgi:hypothetical protein
MFKTSGLSLFYLKLDGQNQWAENAIDNCNKATLTLQPNLEWTTLAMCNQMAKKGHIVQFFSINKK